MGMVDWIDVEVELEGLGNNKPQFITKSFNPRGHRYTITADGRLLFREQSDTVDILTHGTAVPAFKEPIDTEYHGMVLFNGGVFLINDQDEERYYSWSYQAKFTDGQLMEIKLLGDEWSGSNVVGGPRWMKANGYDVD